jgi:hypothetical protein
LETDSHPGREDSNLCISKSDLLNFIVVQWDLGLQNLSKSAASALQFEMRKFESCPPFRF